MLHQVEQRGTVVEVNAGLQSIAAERRQLDGLPFSGGGPREAAAHGVPDHIAQRAALARSSFFRRGQEVRREINRGSHASKCSRHASKCFELVWGSSPAPRRSRPPASTSFTVSGTVASNQNQTISATVTYTVR